MLLVFAGKAEHDHALVHQLRRAGLVATAIDTKLGGDTHNVLRSGLAERLEWLVRARAYDAVFVATPCESYSVRHAPQLRSRAQVAGIEPVPPEWQRYLAKHNALAEVTARLLTAARDAGVPAALENPADRGDPGSPAYWPLFADHGPLWLVPTVRRALEGATRLTFAQCSFAGGRAQKWTTIAATGALAVALAPLGEPRHGCSHGFRAHAEQLTGRDASGRSRATEAAAYPHGMNDFLAGALIAASTAAAAGGSLQPRAGARPDGRITSGPDLGPVADASCELARVKPPGFASPKLHVAAAQSELRAAAFPTSVHAAPTSTKPPGASKAIRRRPLRRGARPGCEDAEARALSSLAAEGAPPTPSAEQPPPPPRRAGMWHAPTTDDDLAALWHALHAAGAPTGPIAIEQLFIGDGYRERVQTWLALADDAAAAIRGGRQPRPVPTRTIGPEELEPWARLVVWDCRDPAACEPVRRSTRDTVFPGERQVDRASLREVAALLGWSDVDQDILEQICEGGLEPRSDCEPLIVLAFHHDSLLQEVELAERRVAADMAEGWSAPLSRHLPFVPCRLQPRGIVLQARTRVLDDGTVEDYLKPRITTDSSFGGIDSVNAGVPGAERAVALPSAQTLGHGWAICDSAYRDLAAADIAEGDDRYIDDDCGRARSLRAGGYCVDAESAYSFCPIQRADWHTQCFAWWDSSGRAGFAFDTRLGFGGAFAVNRFERVSTLIAAYAQHLHAEFDEAQPPPASVRRWTSDRRALQAQGRLPPGEAQLHPRYVQVYIDDLTGAAGCDRVTPPASVRGIVFDDAAAAALGCVPAPMDSRLRVHGQLTVLAITRCGLSASPGKCTVGSPVIGLGLRFRGAQLKIDCPPAKQRAVLHSVAAQRREATEHLRVDRRAARRLVGQLCNLSQVAPAIRPRLHGGYALTEVQASTYCSAAVTLAAGSEAHDAWLELLDTARDLITANEGVAMAPRATASSRRAAGSASSVTDASGDDGFGGYAFEASQPQSVFVMSELWPTWARDALAASADEAQADVRRRDAANALPWLAMPAAELFASIALPLAVARETDVRAVYAVGDCAPACQALENLYSPKPQMRALLRAAEGSTWQWLPAAVPREANVDADRLSHPEEAAAVIAEAEAAGFRVVRVRPSEADWALLRAAIATVTPPSKRKRRRNRPAPAAATPT